MAVEQPAADDKLNPIARSAKAAIVKRATELGIADPENATLDQIDVAAQQLLIQRYGLPPGVPRGVITAASLLHQEMTPAAYFLWLTEAKKQGDVAGRICTKAEEIHAKLNAVHMARLCARDAERRAERARAAGIPDAANATDEEIWAKERANYRIERAYRLGHSCPERATDDELRLLSERASAALEDEYKRRYPHLQQP